MLTFKNQVSNCSIDSEQHNCCSPQPKGKLACPLCQTLSKGVLGKTVEYLLKDKAKENLECFDGFHFCKTPSCVVIYFRDETIIRQEEILIIVGHKEGVKPATVCYCFDWTKEKIKAEIESTGKSTALEDIKEKMDSIGCSCEILNPSGGCCLGDVRKLIVDIKS
jgi:hypothetical protein